MRVVVGTYELVVRSVYSFVQEEGVLIRRYVNLLTHTLNRLFVILYWCLPCKLLSF